MLEQIGTVKHILYTTASGYQDCLYSTISQQIATGLRSRRIRELTTNLMMQLLQTSCANRRQHKIQFKSAQLWRAANHCFFRAAPRGQLEHQLLHCHKVQVGGGEASSDDNITRRRWSHEWVPIAVTSHPATQQDGH